ncbi:MAG: hypothetical protein LBQ66_05865 [Planctomycetaceae bacterium]|nr:hypothetical protein [Planctomycetaceae bacterium]
MGDRNSDAFWRSSCRLAPTLFTKKARRSVAHLVVRRSVAHLTLPFSKRSANFTVGYLVVVELYYREIRPSM